MQDQQFTKVAHAIRCLQQQPHLSLAQLAADAGMSSAHFQRLFASWAGLSPKRFSQFIQRQRLQQLLQNTDDVLQLSEALGVSSPGRLHDLVVTCDAVTPGELLRGGQQVTIEYGFADTPFGTALVGVTARGICYWHFSSGQQEDDLAQLQRSWPSSECFENAALAQSIADQAFAPSGAPKPLHLLLRGSNFQLRVWQALLAIKPGQLATYAQIAALVDSPLAARAVGSAVARNSIAWLIPCHRIIRATGEVGEYRWGGDRKLALLGWEQAMCAGDFWSNAE